MKAKLTNDANKDKGWARLELVFSEDDSPRPGEGESFTLAVQRFPEQSFLQAPGGDRWPRGGAENYLPPDGQEWDGQTLVLELGPNFTSALAKVPCMFSLKGSQGSAFNKIRVDTNKIDLPPQDYDIVIDPKKMEEDRRRQREEEERLRQEEEKRLREEELLWELEAAESLPPAEIPVAPPGAVTEVLAEPDSDGAKKSSKTGLIIAVVVLILALAGGGAAWYFLKVGAGTESEPSTDGAQTAGTESTGQSNGRPEGGEVSSQDPKAAVQELFRRGAPFSELEEALAKYDGQEGAEDAVFLLVMELAPVKPEYRTRLAAFFDPSDPRPAGSIVKNAVTAYDEYEAAKMAGDVPAAEAQARLLQWAKDNAETDASAAELSSRQN